MLQLVKPKTEPHPSLTSDIYTYDQELPIIAEIANTAFQNSLKSVKRLKLFMKYVSFQVYERN